MINTANSNNDNGISGATNLGGYGNHQVALGAMANNGSSANVEIGGSVSNDVLLRAENYALRTELQRLSTEVASLKTVFVCNPGSVHTANGYSSTTGHCESRSNTPVISEDANGEDRDLLHENSQNHFNIQISTEKLKDRDNDKD